MQRDVIQTMVAAEFRRRGMPTTQDECCAIAAAVSVRLETRPWNDELILETAASMADGVFGPAFASADYGQKTAWIDMCERELRKALSS